MTANPQVVREHEAGTRRLAQIQEEISGLGAPNTGEEARHLAALQRTKTWLSEKLRDRASNDQPGTPSGKALTKSQAEELSARLRHDLAYLHQLKTRMELSGPPVDEELYTLTVQACEAVHALAARAHCLSDNKAER